MIFVTIGTDQPFNRLVQNVDEWAKENNRTDVFAQIGETDWKPTHIPYKNFLEPTEFTQCFSSASIIIAHAGMGTILSALRWGKPILVMPRQATLGEQRNEHQMATARHMLSLGKINVAFDDTELRACLNRIDELQPREKIGAFASEALVSALRDFIAHPKA